MDGILNTLRVEPQHQYFTERGFVRIALAVHNSCMTDLVKERALVSGKRIREARTALGWSLEKLAAETGMGASTIGNYEQGTRRFGDVEAQAFVRVFGLTESYWLGLEDLRESRMIVASRGGPQEDFLSLSGHHSLKTIQEFIGTRPRRKTRGSRK